jgi:hypothetical protein
MEKHKPILLNPVQRAELASITKHPGLTVLLEDIIKGHIEQQLGMIFQVQPDDSERITKLAAIAETAYAMQLFYKVVKDEIDRNWNKIAAEEEQRRREAQ